MEPRPSCVADTTPVNNHIPSSYTLCLFSFPFLFIDFERREAESAPRAVPWHHENHALVEVGGQLGGS